MKTITNWAVIFVLGLAAAACDGPAPVPDAGTTTDAGTTEGGDSINPPNACEGALCGTPCVPCPLGELCLAVEMACDGNDKCVPLTDDLCETIIDPPDPCEGKACGETCSTCTEGMECLAVEQFCNADGQCTANQDFVCEEEDPCDGKLCGEQCIPSGNNDVTGERDYFVCDNGGSCVPEGEEDCPIDPFDACTGLECGDSCSTCNGTDCPAVVEQCSSLGLCTAATVVCDDPPDEPCEGKVCGDWCWPEEGAASEADAIAAPFYCDADGDCIEWYDEPELLCEDDGPCAGKVCGEWCWPDGESSDSDADMAMAPFFCDLNGDCIEWYDEPELLCEDQDPCEGKTCGDWCDPWMHGSSGGGAPGPSAYFCDAGGECVEWYDDPAILCQPDEACEDKECGEWCWPDEWNESGNGDMAAYTFCDAQGQCVEWWDDPELLCEENDPCAGKSCGEWCDPWEGASSGGSSGVAPAPMMFLCDNTGECVEWWDNPVLLCEDTGPCAGLGCGDYCDPWSNGGEGDSETALMMPYVCDAQGECIEWYEDPADLCEGEDPCAGKKCGDWCTPNSSSGSSADLAAEPPMYYCDDQGECVEWYQDPQLLCEQPDPCADQLCGSWCNPYGGGDSFDPLPMFCDASGDCVEWFGDPAELCEEEPGPCDDLSCGDWCWPYDSPGNSSGSGDPIAPPSTYCNVDGECIEWFEDPILLCEEEDPCAGKSCGDFCWPPSDETQASGDTALVIASYCDPYGQCVEWWNDPEMLCDEYDPCAGKMCGTSCTICPPGDDNCYETSIDKGCNTNGQCIPIPNLSCDK